MKSHNLKRHAAVLMLITALSFGQQASPTSDASFVRSSISTSTDRFSYCS